MEVQSVAEADAKAAEPTAPVEVGPAAVTPPAGEHHPDAGPAHSQVPELMSRVAYLERESAEIAADREVWKTRAERAEAELSKLTAATDTGVAETPVTGEGAAEPAGVADSGVQAPAEPSPVGEASDPGAQAPAPDTTATPAGEGAPASVPTPAEGEGWPA